METILPILRQVALVAVVAFILAYLTGIGIYSVALFRKKTGKELFSAGKTLRVMGIILMGITALFTIAGGLGTSCVAINPTGYGEGMAPLAPFQWLYIIFVIVTTVIGIMQARAVVMLTRSRPTSYRDALISLIAGIVVGVIHMLVSRSLRGKSMPVDGVVYVTILTLIIFFIYRIPKIWRGVDFTSGGPDDKTGRLAGAITLLMNGILTLTVQYWAGPTHTWGGVNFADAFNAAMTLVGSALVLGGAGFLIGVEKFKITATNPKVQRRSVSS